MSKDVKTIESIINANLSLEDIVQNSSRIILIGNSSIQNILGRPVDAVCPVDGKEPENYQDYPRVIKVEDILNEITPDEPIFIHSLYARQIADILSKAGIKNIIDITHESWRGAQMLDRELIAENLDSIANLYDLLSDDASRNVLTMMLKFRITMDPRLIECSTYRQYHHPVVSPVHGDCLLDGGAFTGDTVLDFSRTLQGNIKGACFEPDKENFKILEHNLYANKLDRKFKAVPLGLWSKSATLSFDSASQSSRIVKNSSNSIKVVDIDTYCKRTGLSPDLIKMDVEGAELEALSGGEKTIRKYMPKMMVSAYHHGAHIWEIPLRLAEMGYTRIFLGHHPPEYTIYETVVYADAW